MLVHNWMTHKVITISPEETVLAAQEMMQEHGIRRLPVVDGGKLVGIITQTDIRNAFPPEPDVSGDLWEFDYLHPLAKRTVAEVMTPDPLTVSPEDTIEEAALVMREHKIEGLPVLQNGQLVGIITESDIFDAMIEIMGFKWGGTRIAVEVEDRPGVLMEVLESFKKQGANIISIATCKSFCSERKGNNEIVIRVQLADVDEIIADLRQRGIKILDVRHSDTDKDAP